MDIIAKKIVFQELPSLSKDEKLSLIRILLETYNYLQKQFEIKTTDFVKRLQAGDYLDAKSILIMLLPKLKKKK